MENIYETALYKLPKGFSFEKLSENFEAV